jgi:hypothetical protein
MKLFEITDGGYISGFKTLEAWEKKVKQIHPEALIRKRDDRERWMYIARTKEDWKEQDKKSTQQDSTRCLARAAVIKKDNYFVEDIAGIWTKDYKAPIIPNRINSKITRLNPYKVGDRVRLKPNKEEGWDEEFGTVIDIGDIIPKEYTGKGRSEMIVIKLDDKYLSGKTDDGIREVNIDDVERENVR